jgi:hypothetical protein
VTSASREAQCLLNWIVLSVRSAAREQLNLTVPDSTRNNARDDARMSVTAACTALRATCRMHVRILVCDCAPSRHACCGSPGRPRRPLVGANGVSFATPHHTMEVLGWICAGTAGVCYWVARSNMSTAAAIKVGCWHAVSSEFKNLFMLSYFIIQSAPVMALDEVRSILTSAPGTVIEYASVSGVVAPVSSTLRSYIADSPVQAVV